MTYGTNSPLASHPAFPLPYPKHTYEIWRGPPTPDVKLSIFTPKISTLRRNNYCRMKAPSSGVAEGDPRVENQGVETQQLVFLAAQQNLSRICLSSKW